MTAALWFIGGLLASLLILVFHWLHGSRIAGRLLWWRRVTITIFDEGNTVPNATVTIAGWGRHQTNNLGQVRIYIPRHDAYGLIVHTPNSQAGHYMLEIEPGEHYEYAVGEGNLKRRDASN